MNLPIYDSLKLAEDAGYVSLTGIAEVLGRKRGTVHMWVKRRRTTKFPDQVAIYRIGKLKWPLYDLKAVEDWHRTYVPSKGGAPIGNRNWAGRAGR